MRDIIVDHTHEHSVVVLLCISNPHYFLFFCRPLTPVVLDQAYINLKSQVIKAERRVLKELGFCVHVKHPHKLIVMYLKYLEFEQHQQMMQMAWNYMNDSFRTDVFVRFQPEKIACACIYLTARTLNIPLPSNPPWFGVFMTTEAEIIDICFRILALYKRTKPSIDKLEKAVDVLKDQYQEQRKKDKPGQSTPPAVVKVDRTNGSHNAWGGFISRALPVTNNEENEKDKSPKKQSSKSSRSRSRSRNSRSGSRSPPDDKYHHRRRRSRTRSRSRSRTPSHKKNKKRNYSRSSSPSPIRSKHKKK